MQTRPPAPRGDHDPRAPCTPAPWLPGPPGLCAHPPRRGAAEGLRARARTAHLPGPRPRLAAAGSTAASAVSPAALLRSASPQRRSRRYPTSIFFRFKGKSDQLFCSRSGSAAPSPAAARGPGGLASPASSRALLRPSRPAAPPAAARSARLPAPPAAARRAPCPDVTGRSRAPASRGRARAAAPPPRPAPPGGPWRARARGHVPRRRPELRGERAAPPRPRSRARPSRCPLAPACWAAGTAACGAGLCAPPASRGLRPPVSLLSLPHPPAHAS